MTIRMYPLSADIELARAIARHGRLLPERISGALTWGAEMRPVRRTLRGHLRGIPLSGRALDAFPSGHAVHVGTPASAGAVLPPANHNLAWAIIAVLVSTRVLRLVRRANDVLAGLAIGAALDRVIRRLTRFGRQERSG